MEILKLVKMDESRKYYVCIEQHFAGQSQRTPKKYRERTERIINIVEIYTVDKWTNNSTIYEVSRIIIRRKINGEMLKTIIVCLITVFHFSLLLL